MILSFFLCSEIIRYWRGQTIANYVSNNGDVGEFLLHGQGTMARESVTKGEIDCSLTARRYDENGIL